MDNYIIRQGVLDNLIVGGDFFGIGVILTKLRAQTGLTQYEVAERIGVSRSRYNSWEQNTNPRNEMLNKLADFYNVTPDYLLGYEATKAPEWATEKDKRDLKSILEQDGEITFDGVPLDEDTKRRVMDILIGLFWEAKEKSKKGK